ncbi:MAG: DUF2191 domain-containing protein [Candidatus Wallbacteria bacterium]|nr:DUF2191 domain-containing protein [Candidatus Wallbacteria bacterium]
MRTTLSLDDDVAALLERARKRRQSGLKETVNEALRRGLREMTAPAPRVEPYRTPSVSLGRCLVGSLDDVEEVLAIAEEESVP